ncbi:hypothetical protein BGX27_006118, partial [Mortierella sp. AM989]
MVTQPPVLPDTGSALGSPSRGSICDSQELQDTSVHELEIRSHGHRSKRSSTRLVQSRETIHLSPLESHSSHIDATQTSTIVGDTDYSQLEGSHLVPSPTVNDKSPTSSSSSVRRSSRLGKRCRDHDEEPNMVVARMEHLKQLAMHNSGLDDNVVNIFQNATTEAIKRN